MAPHKGNIFAKTHGLCRTPEYLIWNAARNRCTNPRDPAYQHYGGRGVTMCSEWIKSFLPFYAEVGPRPSSKHTLDRIKNDKGYEPGNCRWVTRNVQMRNTRRNIFVGGETVQDWAIRHGVRAGAIYLRLKRGWTIEQATKHIGKLLRINPATEVEA